MTNLIQVNTQIFVDLMPYINILWSGPFQIIICIVLLWQHLGQACLAGVVVMFLFIPLNAFLTNRNKVFQTKKLKQQDSRVKLTNEILCGIKVLKFNGWENSFRNLVEKIRQKELNIFYKKEFNYSLIKFSFEMSSLIVNN